MKAKASRPLRAGIIGATSGGQRGWQPGDRRKVVHFRQYRQTHLKNILENFNWKTAPRLPPMPLPTAWSPSRYLSNNLYSSAPAELAHLISKAFHHPIPYSKERRLPSPSGGGLGKYRNGYEVATGLCNIFLRVPLPTLCLLSRGTLPWRTLPAYWSRKVYVISKSPLWVIR